MSFSSLPAAVQDFFLDLARWLDKRSARRVPDLLLGLLFAWGRRTVTSWFRAGGLYHDWRQAYVTVCAIGRHFDDMALSVPRILKPVLTPRRLLLGLDDTPTPRYGPCVEGAGIHHNPTPGPAGHQHVYGHVWVVLSALARHPDRGTVALPLQAQLYIRAADIDTLPPERARAFRTKLELAVAQLRWLKPWVQHDFEQLWVAADGAYAKRPFLLPARRAGWVVVSRLRKDAQLWDLPPSQRRPGQRGPLPTYGKNRIVLAERAAQADGWEEVECVQYGARVRQTVQTFLATYRPAGGLIRVVLVRQEDGWLPLFCTDPNATVVEVLEAYADRGAVEQLHKDLKEVWGAGQQQVRNLDSSVGCLNLNLWLYSLVEVWSWDQEDEEVCDRSGSPWDREARRPSHADKRKALQRAVWKQEIAAAVQGEPTAQGLAKLVERLLTMAA
jgi:DDE superfamily endonuclease